MTKTARTRMITYLSLGAIVVPAVVGWNAATSSAQTVHGLASSVIKNYRFGAAGEGRPKVVPLTAGEVAALGLSSTGAMSSVQQTQAFADPAFQRTWERTDKPVAARTVQRSWYWGPTPNSGALQEDYAEGAGGKRLVQYFDKSRMEINNPASDPNSKFFVTNGLLSVELISGKVQTGNSTYADRYPADIPMASDPDDANAPTYYSFQGVSNTPLGDHPANSRVGLPATSTIARNGTVGDDQTKSTYPKVNYAYYDPGTKHNVPQAIWEFLNDTGPVYDSASAKTTNGRLSDPWFYATGLPISEPYWARVKIAGQQQDVLIQAFERRVVTYVPNGVPGFKVQMGNIGQHYYDWRYKDAGRPQGPLATPTTGAGATNTPAPGNPPATTVPQTPTTGPVVCTDVPPAKDATITPLCGPVGTVFEIRITGFTPGEKISLWLTLPNGEITGTDEPIDAGNHPGTLNDEFDSSILEGAPPSAVEGVWSITYQGDTSRHQSVVYFRITPDAGNPGQTPTAAPTRDPSVSSCNNVPASQNMTITPSNCARAGTSFQFVGRGFQPGENISAYITDPTQAVTGIQQQITAGADGVTGAVPFNSRANYPLGIWAMTMEGATSHARAIGYFKLIP